MFHKCNVPYYAAPMSFLNLDDAYLQIPLGETGLSNVVLGDDSVARAVSNVCAHRGMEILPKPIGQAKFVCKYHGWRYCSKGNLRQNRVVGRSPNITLGKLNLSQFSGFASVGSTDASEIKKVIDFTECDVGKAPFHWECLQHDANWKWLTENVLEAYHLDFVHRKSFVEQGFIMSEDIKNERFGRSSAMFLPKKKYGRGFYKHGYAFPNLFLSNTSDFITFCSIIIPIHESKSNLYWFLFPGKKLQGLPEDLQREICAESIKFTKKVLEEDKEMVESQQRGCGPHRTSENLTDVEPRLKWFWESLRAAGLK